MPNYLRSRPTPLPPRHPPKIRKVPKGTWASAVKKRLRGRSRGLPGGGGGGMPRRPEPKWSTWFSSGPRPPRLPGLVQVSAPSQQMRVPLTKGPRTKAATVARTVENMHTRTLRHPASSFIHRKAGMLHLAPKELHGNLRSRKPSNTFDYNTMQHHA